jgi:glutathione peroxidase
MIFRPRRTAARKSPFTKFLIDREGNVVERYEPITSPSAMSAAIEKFL